MFELARVYLKQDEYYPGKGFKEKALPVLEDLVKNHSKGDAAAAAKKLLDTLKAF